MGVLHLGSGGVMVALANDFTLPVSSFALSGPPGTPLSEGVINSVVDIPLGLGTATFLFLSAFFHFLISSPWGSSATSPNCPRAATGSAGSNTPCPPP